MKLQLLFLLSFIPAILMAQVDDPKAKAILNEVIKKSKGYETIKADFSYTLDNKKNKVHDGYSGTVLIKGEKYRLTIAGQTVIYNNNTVWTYIKGANEVQINEVDDNEDAITPTRVLNGSYLTNFRPKYINETKRAGKVLDVIDMVPLQGKSYFKVRVEIDKASKSIVSFSVYDKNGSIYAYTIDKFQTNLKVNDADFVFRASDFPGAEINDLR